MKRWLLGKSYPGVFQEQPWHGVLLFQAEKRSGSPWIAMFSREYRAQLVLAIAMPFFQMATGINAVIFFSPQLFGGIGSFGEGAKGGLIASAVIGIVQVRMPSRAHGDVSIVRVCVSCTAVMQMRRLTLALFAVVVCRHLLCKAAIGASLYDASATMLCTAAQGNTGGNCAWNFQISGCATQFWLGNSSSMHLKASNSAVRRVA